MLKKLIKNKRAQNTAEYAILISLVVAGIIAMQTYAQRALQSRVRSAGLYLTSETSALGADSQYEPYYLETNYLVSRNEFESQILDTNIVQHTEDSNRTRAIDGNQTSTYGTFLPSGL